MAKNKVTLTGMGLKKLEVGVREVDFNDSIIEVIEYIPTPTKFAIINDTLTISYVNGIFHPVAMEAAFHALLIEATTNINFSKKEQENLITTYDLLNKAGVIDVVCDELGDEYDRLVEDLMKVLDKNEGKVKSFAEQLAELVASFSGVIKELNDLDENDVALIKDVMDKMGTTPKQ